MNLKKIASGSSLVLLAMAGPAHAATTRYEFRIPLSTGAAAPPVNPGTPTTPPDEQGGGILSGVGFPMAFATQQVNSVGESLPFSIQNQGTRNLSVRAVTLSGDVANFFLSSDCAGKVLIPTGFCSGTVEFHATGSPESKEARITVDHDGTGAREFVASGVSVLPSVLTTAALNFPATPVGEDARAAVTVTNNGIGALALSGATLSSASSYALEAGTCATSLSPGASCTYGVKFTPAVVANAEGSLVINTAAGVRNVPLSGTGRLGALNFSASTVAVPKSFVNVKGESAVVTLSNTGNYPVSGLAFGDAAPFVIVSNTCGGALAAGANCTFKVALTPADAQTYSKILVVSGSQGLNSSIGLTGTGEALPPKADYVSGWLQSQMFRMSALETPPTVVFKNGGGGTVTVLSMKMVIEQGTMTADFVKGCGIGSALTAGQTCEVQMKSTPVVDSENTATITIETTAGQIIFKRKYQYFP
jgi:hypothetical protein